MFKTPSRTLLFAQASTLALCMIQPSLMSASAADITNLRSGRINTLGAIRRVHPGALSGAYGKQIPNGSTHRSPTLPTPPPSRGQVKAPHVDPRVHAPGGLRSRIVDGIRRLRSVSPPRRTTGRRNRLSEQVQKRKAVGSRHTTGRAVRILSKPVTTTTPRNPSSKPSMDHLIGRGGHGLTLNEKIAQKIAERRVADKEAGTKDDQVKVVTGAQQAINPKLKGDGPSIVTSATQTHDGTVRTDSSSDGAQKFGDNAGNALPYDEFRENDASTPSASDRPQFSAVPGITLAGLESLKDGLQFDNSSVGEGRPGGAGAFELMPEWLGAAPALTMPGGTDMAEPEGVKEVPPDTSAGLNGSKGNRPGHVSSLGGGADAAFSKGGSGTVNPSMNDNRTMQGGGTPAEEQEPSDDYIFTEAEQDAENASPAEMDGYRPDREYYEDGSSNDYSYAPNGYVRVRSYNANGERTQTTFIDPYGNAITNRENRNRGAISPCAGVHGQDECPGVISDAGANMPADALPGRGQAASRDAIATAIRGDWVKQGNPEATTGGTLVVNGQPIGQWRSGTPYVRGGVDCRMAKCDDTVQDFGSGSSMWTPFNVFAMVVNPVPQP